MKTEKKDNTLIIIMIIILAIFLFRGFLMVVWGLLFMSLITLALVLLIIWLIKQIQK